MLRRLAAWVAGVWCGVMAGLAFIAAPALFAALPHTDAGRVASTLFAQDAYVGLALGALLLIMTLQRARLDAERGVGSRFSTDMILALLALFCVIAGHFGVQPMIEASRQGRGGLSFGALHGVSMAFFAGKLLAASVLAWRLTAEAAAKRSVTAAATIS